MVHPCEFGENSSIGSRYISYIQDYDLENGVMVTKNIVNSLDWPEGIAVLDLMGIQPKDQEIYQFYWNFRVYKSSCDLENEVKVTKI